MRRCYRALLMLAGLVVSAPGAIGAARAEVPPTRSPANAACHEAVTRAASAPPAERAATVWRGCRDLFVLQRCEAAWDLLAQGAPDARLESLATECLPVYCGEPAVASQPLCTSALPHYAEATLEDDFLSFYRAAWSVDRGIDVTAPSLEREMGAQLVAGLLFPSRVSLPAASVSTPPRLDPLRLRLEPAPGGLRLHLIDADGAELGVWDLPPEPADADYEPFIVTLSEMAPQDPAIVIGVRPDIAYQAIIDLINALRHSGITRFSLSTVEE